MAKTQKELRARRAANLRWRIKHKDRIRVMKRAEKLQRFYGLTVADYEAILFSQNGVCAVCLRPNHEFQYGKRAALHVDHNHETKQVRGLLCGNCNRALGILHEDPLRIEALARYIRETDG
jgi:hypothetical protein